MPNNFFWRSLVTARITGLVGCAETTPIQPAGTTKSAFANAVYKGETVATSTPVQGNEAYRVFIQGATGFVSMQSVRDAAEQRANLFCARKGKAMESLSETTAKPPYIFGNFPRIEIVFDCVDVPPAPSAMTTESKYTKLAALRKLLDDGTITREEFESEKAKLLLQP